MKRSIPAALIFVLGLVADVTGQEAVSPKPKRNTAVSQERSSVYVEPITITEVSDRTGPGLNVGSVVFTPEFAAGIQKAADVWGVNLDLFVSEDRHRRQDVVVRMVDALESAVIVEALKGEEWYAIQMDAFKRGVPMKLYGPYLEKIGFQEGWDAFKSARAGLLSRIPKYEEILAIAFPVSPLPANFFQPSGFVSLQPMLRVSRTVGSPSATSHSHTGCMGFEQTGNLLFRAADGNTDLFLLGMEGGILSLQATPGATEPGKAAAVMTATTLSIRGAGGSQREVVLENDGTATSVFKPAIQEPAELTSLLNTWVTQKKISGFEQISPDELLLKDWNGRDRLLRAGMFVVASPGYANKPGIEPGQDKSNRMTLDFQSSRGLRQQLAEVDAASKTNVRPAPAARLPFRASSSVGNTVGATLQSLLTPMKPSAGRPQPFLLAIEGGHLVVTPEAKLGPKQLSARVARVDIDLRGPLTSDQTITISLDTREQLVFRRTVLDFDALDRALASIRGEGFIQDWKYEGSRGRGLSANVVLQGFFGKHRKFMSSIVAWQPDEKPGQPLVRFYDDDMQRLNFALVTPGGWRQEFVEVPLGVPPVPRDVELHSAGSRVE